MNRGGLFWGRVTAEALGEEPERFFNLLSRREIPVYDIRKEDAPSAAESGKNGKLRAVLFTAAPEDMKRMKPIARKAGVRLRIKKKERNRVFPFSYAEAEASRRRSRGVFLSPIFPVFVCLGYFCRRQFPFYGGNDPPLSGYASGFLRNAPVKGLLQFH